MSDSAISTGKPAGVGRIVSLDALRGLAILLMIFSGMLPKTLPNWVDHGYQPHYKPDSSGTWTIALDPNGNARFDPNWHAYTWVDLVFPMFLFAMGAAIPQALKRRRAAGAGGGRLIAGIFGRWLTLVVFAVLVDQLTVGQFKADGHDTSCLLTLVGFALAFLFFVRWPARTPAIARFGMRAGTLVAIAALIAAYVVGPDGAFSWDQSDTIILVLADTYLVAAVACVLTAGLPWLRFGLLVPLMLLIHWVALGPDGRAGWEWVGSHPQLLHVAAKLNATFDVANWADWIRDLCDEHDGLRSLLNFSHLWNVVYLKHLWTVIPGTVAGEWIARWSAGRPSMDGEGISELPKLNRLVPLVAALLVCVATFVGLRHYGFPLAGIGGPLRTPWLTLVLTVPAVAWMGVVVMPRTRDFSWINRNLFVAGVAFLGLGLGLDCLPIGGGRFFEGGISKGPPTSLGYHFTSAGLCMLLLTGLIAAFDAPGRRPSRAGIIAANGQNPLMAYYLSHAVLAAVLGLGILRLIGHPFGPGIDSLGDLMLAKFGVHDLMLVLVAAIKTLAIALFVWAMTRAQIFWRA